MITGPLSVLNGLHIVHIGVTLLFPQLFFPLFYMSVNPANVRIARYLSGKSSHFDPVTILGFYEQ